MGPITSSPESKVVKWFVPVRVERYRRDTVACHVDASQHPFKSFRVDNPNRSEFLELNVTELSTNDIIVRIFQVVIQDYSLTSRLLAFFPIIVFYCEFGINTGSMYILTLSHVLLRLPVHVSGFDDANHAADPFSM